MREPDKNGLQDRAQWGDRWGFILACIGSAVGMANVWAFPYRAAKYGGGAFLIAYLTIALFLGLIGVSGEIAFGRWGRTGPLGTFRKALEQRRLPLRNLGVIPILGSLAIGIGYAVVIAWVLRYTAGSVTGSLLTADTGAYFGAITGNFGSVSWHLLGLAITFVVMIAGINSGIERINKFMMPLFFLLFLIMAIRVAFLPGAIEGYRYLFIPRWEYLLKADTWVYALGQCFFSLSLAGSGTVVYGSYLDDGEDCITCARRIAIFDTLAALLASMVVIPAVFAFGLDPSSGPPLLFITMPAIFQSIPGGRFIAVIFFVAILFAGLTSIVNLFETPIEALENRFRLSRKKASAIVVGIAAVIGVFIENGSVVSAWMDAVSIYIIPIGALLSAVLLFWVMGPDFARTEMGKGRLKPPGRWVDVLGKYVFCLVTITVILLGIAKGGI